jgi:hypothetical protein
VHLVVRRLWIVRRAAGLLLLLLALGLAPGLGAAQGQPLELARYESLLREARAAALRGDRLEVEQAAAALAVTAVLMPDNTLAPVDTAWLTAELRKPAPDLPTVAARLGALIDALAYVAPPAPPGALERLEQILARPPFGRPDDTPGEQGALERFIIWLLQQLGGLFRPVAAMAGGTPGTTVSWLLIALGAALVLAVLGLWLRGLRRALGSEATIASPAELAARDTADARAQASALAREGDYRGAARLLALAALLWLDESGILPYDPHQTNREHLGRLGERPAARAGLAPIVDTADRVWYGGAPLDAVGYAEVERQVEALRSLEARSGPATATQRTH